MSDDVEQIGELCYRPNPDFPYPLPIERPPHFWMTEETGKLADAVETYLNGDPLSPSDLDVIRQYLRQYVERAILTGDAKRHELLAEIGTLRSAREIEQYADELAEYGAEPF